MAQPANTEQFEGGASEWLLRHTMSQFAEDNSDSDGVLIDEITPYGIVTLTFRPFMGF